MRLLIQTDAGRLIEVTDELEDYDLSKPLAGADLVEDIRSAVVRARAGEVRAKTEEVES